MRVLAYVVAAVALFALGFWVGNHGGVGQLAGALARPDLQGRVGQLRAEVEHLTARLAIAERSVQVADGATERVRQQVIAYQDELRRLRSELGLYKGIVSERSGAPGLRVHALEPLPGLAGLELVIVRGRPDGKPVSGRVEVRLLDDAVDVSDPGQLFASSPAAATAGYTFEFFQRLLLDLHGVGSSGRALVTLLPEGEETKPIHDVRSWPASG